MSVLNMCEIVGTSPTSWEYAVRNALATNSKSLEDQRVAEIVRHDVTFENGKVTSFSVTLNISYKDREGALPV